MAIKRISNKFGAGYQCDTLAEAAARQISYRRVFKKYLPGEGTRAVEIVGRRTRALADGSVVLTLKLENGSQLRIQVQEVK
jgi:hypothetical protein